MQCTNHPGAAAVARCAGCAEPFCANCLVDIGGKKYCGSCKTMEATAADYVPEEALIPCKEAGEALTYSIIGLFCCGIILGPIAISKAMTAKSMMSQNPRLSGAGKATAGLIIGIIATTLHGLGLIVRVIQMSQGPTY